MTGLDDARLVRRVLDGDRAAYRLLVQRHEDTLFRRARALLGGDGDLAADVVQDAFLRAYQKLATCSRPEAFGGWVYRAVRNRCYDELRAARRRGAELTEVAGLASEDDPAADLERDHLRTLIRDALDDLTPTLREAFVMKHIDGLSYDEMQDATGVALSALKMRVKRAREDLETRLRPLVEAASDVTPGGPSTSSRVEGG